MSGLAALSQSNTLKTLHDQKLIDTNTRLNLAGLMTKLSGTSLVIREIAEYIQPRRICQGLAQEIHARGCATAAGHLIRYTSRAAENTRMVVNDIYHQLINDMDMESYEQDDSDSEDWGQVCVRCPYDPCATPTRWHTPSRCPACRTYCNMEAKHRVGYCESPFYMTECYSADEIYNLCTRLTEAAEVDDDIVARGLARHLSVMITYMEDNHEEPPHSAPAFGCPLPSITYRRPGRRPPAYIEDIYS